MSDELQRDLMETSTEERGVQQYEGTPMERMMQMALSNDNIEALERLIALKNQEEERACKKEFDFHFAEMQKELVPVEKKKDGSKTNSGKVTFKYAPIEDCQAANDEIISRHGFSYKWREEALENGMKRVRIVITGWGHTDDSVFFDVPKVAGNSLQTEIQMEGVRSGYGKRYTYVMGFGLTVKDEDLDGGQLDEAMYAEEIQKLEKCRNPEELKEVFVEVYNSMGNNMAGKLVVTEKKNELKNLMNSGGE